MSTALREPPVTQVVVADVETRPPSRTHHPWRHFWRHFAEMSVVMVIGMVAAAFFFMVVLNVVVHGDLTWEQALSRYPTHALLAVAVGMSVPMIPWMLHRGHTRRSAYEMAIVMAVLVVPFVCLALFDIVKGAQCGLYCLAGFIAMLALMFYRRSEYGANVPVSRMLARFNRNVANPVMGLFAGWVPPFSIVTHRGRRSGRTYRTPAWAFRTSDGLAFAALYGPDSDWVRNVVAADHAEVKRLGKTASYGQARLIERKGSETLVPAVFRPVFRLMRVKAFLQLDRASDTRSQER